MSKARAEALFFTAMTRMRVEVWSDIICPWCGLGLHRLHAALERFEHKADVEIVHRSFQLDERAPTDKTESVRSMLKKKGFPEAQIEAMTARVSGLAAAEGLTPYRVLDNTVGNTQLAHEFAAWASEQGKGEAAWDLLFKTYFGEAQSVFELEALLPLAKKIGLSVEDAREALTSHRYTDRVRAEARDAAQLGANGVPFFVFDRQLAVGGAQPADLLLQALERSWTARKQA